MPSVKSHSPDLHTGAFAVVDPPSTVTTEEMDTIRAANERVDRYYKNNSDAAETDRKLNDELRGHARRASARSD